MARSVNVNLQKQFLLRFCSAVWDHSSLTKFEGIKWLCFLSLHHNLPSMAALLFCIIRSINWRHSLSDKSSSERCWSSAWISLKRIPEAGIWPFDLWAWQLGVDLHRCAPVLRSPWWSCFHEWVIFPLMIPFLRKTIAWWISCHGVRRQIVHLFRRILLSCCKSESILDTTCIAAPWGTKYV